MITLLFDFHVLYYTVYIMYVYLHIYYMIPHTHKCTLLMFMILPFILDDYLIIIIKTVNMYIMWYKW
jgi:hypothetical protein